VFQTTVHRLFLCAQVKKFRDKACLVSTVRFHPTAFTASTRRKDLEGFNPADPLILKILIQTWCERGRESWFPTKTIFWGTNLSAAQF